MVLPADADPNDPSTWLPLRGLLESFAQSPIRRRLLVLDIMQRVRDPRLDILSGDVAARVEDELKAVPDEGRLTLVSCSPGQTTEVSEVLGRSAFSFFLEQGLRGPADGAGAAGSSDGIITVSELAAYLATHVDSWVQRNRGTRQRPMLHGSVGSLNFPLVFLASSRTQPQFDVPAPEITRPGCSRDGGFGISGPGMEVPRSPPGLFAEWKHHC